MATASPVDPESGFSQITIIDTVANYYKHHYEWTDQDWLGPYIQNQTIQNSIRLGLEAKEYFNMHRALAQPDISLRNMSPLADLVVKWRSDLAQHIRLNGRGNGFRYHEDSGNLTRIRIRESEAWSLVSARHRFARVYPPVTNNSGLN